MRFTKIVAIAKYWKVVDDNSLTGALKALSDGTDINHIGSARFKQSKRLHFLDVLFISNRQLTQPVYLLTA